MGGTAGGVPPGTVVVKLPRNWRSTSFHGTEREIPLFISLSTAHRHVGAILHSPRSGSRNKLQQLQRGHHSEWRDPRERFRIPIEILLSLAVQRLRSGDTLAALSFFDSPMWHIVSVL